MRSDPPDVILGIPAIPDAIFPLVDPSLPVQDMTTHFAVWCSGHYDNGDSPEKYQYGDHLGTPPPTVSTLTQEEREATLHTVPGDPRGGSDHLLMLGGVPSGVFASIRKAALCLPAANVKCKGDPWRRVEVRHLWCDRSPWVIPWAVTNVRRELGEEAEAGIALRNVVFFRVRGANHFVSDSYMRCAIPATRGHFVDFLDRFTGRTQSERWMPSWRLPPIAAPD